MTLWDSQVTSAGALFVALQHPAITGDLKTVCSLLQTCKSWRAALQQCSAGHLTIHTVSSVSHKLTRLSHIAVWLPKHCGMVGELVVRYNAFDNPNRLTDESAAAEQVLALSVQLAATRAAAAAAEAAPLLRLRSVTLLHLQSPALLQALPAGALTQLSLTCRKVGRTHMSVNSSSITQALARLTALQQLHLSAVDEHSSWLQSACLAAVGHLLQLTKLHMCRVGPGSDLSLLPRQLRQLQLRVACGGDDSSSSSTAVALGHLSALQQLELKLDGAPALCSCLPAGLTGLTVQGAASDGECGCSSMQHLSIAPLQQLRQLRLQDAVVDVRELRALSEVSALSSITLSYGWLKHASDTAPAWQHLPALKSLCLLGLCLSGPDEPAADGADPELDPLDKAASLTLLECLAAATSLTQLQLRGCGKQPEQAWCGYLTSLQQLHDLELSEQLPYDRVDMLQLTTLTNLTSLSIVRVAALDDAAAAALAVRLTKLRQLSLAGVGLCSAAALPVIAALTGLTRLMLRPLAEMRPLALSRDDLMLLTPLTQLRWLNARLLFNKGVVDELWDAGHRMWRQQLQQL